MYLYMGISVFVYACVYCIRLRNIRLHIIPISRMMFYFPMSPTRDHLLHFGRLSCVACHTQVRVAIDSVPIAA